ncbi:hypothetical protein [Streptococcus oricebi]|uniref:Uncharacterized protein n=1 Tax=Streptococcus oricebi TaxID=1547447 RepID=A0ABS5B0R4_9STRE|nr:hypothetical protein [Streptococcus oricebi]MBP2622424.1 hypothetical protein [Streptococcus oricebi]
MNFLKFFTSGENWLKILPILISLVALAFSVYSFFINSSRTKYMDTTNFHIIQNFWQENPSYTLYNESTKPLTSPPHPTYLMYIPSVVKREETTFLVLLPISYENVKSQTLTGKTIDEVMTSTLPKNFYAKKGMRDVKERNLGNGVIIRTYPFLLIATQVKYSYKDNPKDLKKITFLSTSVGDKIEISEEEWEDLKNYTKNIDLIKGNEVKINGEQSIYKTAHDYLVKEFDRINSDDDKVNLLALAGLKIDSDTLNNKLEKTNNFMDVLKVPDEDNFNSITYKLLYKYHILPQDPLVPDY